METQAELEKMESPSPIKNETIASMSHTYESLQKSPDLESPDMKFSGLPLMHKHTIKSFQSGKKTIDLDGRQFLKE